MGWVVVQRPSPTLHCRELACYVCDNKLYCGQVVCKLRVVPLPCGECRGVQLPTILVISIMFPSMVTLQYLILWKQREVHMVRQKPRTEILIIALLSVLLSVITNMLPVGTSP